MARLQTLAPQAKYPVRAGHSPASTSDVGEMAFPVSTGAAPPASPPSAPPCAPEVTPPHAASAIAAASDAGAHVRRSIAILA
jgi:hypothetical protein